MADTHVNMPDQAALRRQEEALEKKNKWMYPVVITALIVIFTAGFIYGIQLLLNMEGAFPPVVLSESKTAAPQSAEELVAYLNDVVANALEARPKTNSEWTFRIHSDSIETDGPDTLKKTLRFLVDPAEDAISGKIDKQSSDFGEDMRPFLRIPSITADDVESFSCDYIFYQCKACGEISAGPVEDCPVCGSDYPYQMHYQDHYSFTVTLKNDSDLADRLFAPGADEILSMAEPDLRAFAGISDVKPEIKGLSIRFETDRATDELRALVYHKDVSAAAAVTVSQLSPQPESAACSADFTEETVYTFTWPGIQLNKPALTLAPGKKEQITAERICDDPKAYAVTWTSSDETVLTVDQKGYVKAGRNPGKSTVTASFSFNGKTYSASCDVTVKVSVQYMQLNKHRLTLNPGGTETLKARVAADNKGFAMKKPTVQTVTWYTTDEAVATVDENGLVTAVAPGTATVYALSDDGYYRSSCEVTVK